MAGQIQQLLFANCQLTNSEAQCMGALQALLTSTGNKHLAFLLQASDSKLTAAVTTAMIRDFSWTDITYLLYKNNVSWKYYLFPGPERTQPRSLSAGTILADFTTTCSLR
jgi:hypothetical protein